MGLEGGALIAFALVLCRCAGAAALMPALGEEEAPASLRAGLAVALAFLIAPLVPAAAAGLDRPLALAGAVAGELGVGVLLGFLARVWCLALPLAGQITSLLTGLSSVLQPDPMLGAGAAVLGTLCRLLAPVLILALGLHAPLLRALAGSYAVFPLAAVVPRAGDLLAIAVRAAGGSLALSVELAAPFLAAGLIFQVSLGLLSRLVPQMQVYFASLPVQVLGGLALLALFGSAIAARWAAGVSAAFGQLPGY